MDPGDQGIHSNCSICPILAGVLAPECNDPTAGSDTKKDVRKPCMDIAQEDVLFSLFH